MSPLLEVKNLEVFFSIHGRKLHAVRDISFEVFPGESIGIVGESGCGKSSAVQALTKLNVAEQIKGQAIFHGRDLLQASPKELRQVRGKEIGMIFQDPMTFLNPTMKIGRQIAEGLLHHKLSTKKEADQRAIELLKLVGVPAAELRVNQYPNSLSGGMRQRVLIAMAIACNPLLLIADEPTTALDVTVSSQILELLKGLQKKLKMSLLLITHDIHSVSFLCDRVLVMYGGKIVEQGETSDVLLQPKHPYTQMLLKAIPRLDLPKQEALVPIEGSPPNLFLPTKGCSFVKRCPYAFSKCSEEPPLKNSAACWKAHETKENLSLEGAPT